ncbi:MAG: GH92 family glycosyl hydrolase [Ferruginibacter sp.]
MIKYLFCLLFSLSLSPAFCQNYNQYVNPFIGTGGHGHTYPGATLPHGMVQLSPDTRLDGWDGCGGYHYSDHFIYGFSHTHLSGTGVSDWGDILLMPMNGAPSPDNKTYGSAFNHENEKASPGFYSVKLADDNINVSLTATERTGFHKYIFNSSDQNNIILDLKHRDEVIESSIHIEDSITVTGLRRSKAWADNQYVFFIIKFSKPIKDFGIWENDSLVPKRITEFSNSKNLKAFLQFDLSRSKEILVKVGISSVSIEGARKNLATENLGWDFNAVKNAAEKKWNNELGKIDVKSASKDKLVIFYTALYHTAIVPNINMDVNGQYRGRDDKIHVANGFVNYSVFSLWDTYRAAHPLYTIIDQHRTLDYIKTFLAQYEQGARLPVWELSSCETDCMIGYHSVPVIVDAYNKGIKNFNTSFALEAMKKSATWNHLGLPALMKKNMIEVDDESESVSKTLEYAFDDWCIASFARSLGKIGDYNTFIKRAQAYKNMLDNTSAFMQPRQNGGWMLPFDPKEVNNNFTEANSWQYSFYMPQDLTGYMKLTGGKAELEAKLDKLFTEDSKTTGRDQSDISGLIGQYAHGNEPSHHIAYLYSFAGVPGKTQQRVQQIMNEMYHNAPDGLSGNEDCGQMSAWYVLSALGFYPVTPGSNTYIIGTPAFENATLHLENRKAFTITRKGDANNFYISTASLNNQPYQKSFISHKDLMAGGKLQFTMSAKATSWGNKDIPTTFIDDSSFVINPTINGGKMAFKGIKKIFIFNPGMKSNVFYTMNGTEPSVSSIKYSKPFTSDTSVIIKAIAIDDKGNKSAVVTAIYKKLPHDWNIKLNTTYEQQYTAGGAEGLVDGLRGDVNWRKGYWQGYQLRDLDAIIDLGKITTVSKLTAGFLQDTRAWIVMPKSIAISVSEDGINYKNVYEGKDFLPIENLNPQVKNIDVSFPATLTRYVRIVAKQYGKLPSWHEGAGGDTHIFVDEISVE